MQVKSYHLSLRSSLCLFLSGRFTKGFTGDEISEHQKCFFLTSRHDFQIFYYFQIEEDAYQDDLGFSLGTLGKSKTSRIRGPQIDSKTKARISKTLHVSICFLFHSKKPYLSYCKCSKISNTFLFLFVNKMLVIRAGIHKCIPEYQTGKILIRQLLQTLIWVCTVWTKSIN